MTSKTRTYSNRLLYKGHHYRSQHSIGGLLIAADPKGSFPDIDNSHNRAQTLTACELVCMPSCFLSVQMKHGQV